VTPRSVLAMVLAAVVAGCLRERDRLDVPRVVLVLEDSTIAPGDSVRGFAYALDATGIVFLQVTATTTDSISSKRLNRVSADSVKIDFALRVPANAPADVPVRVQALARDTQDFEVSIEDTVFVRIRAGSR
jgi:hypothetical protein